MPHHSLNNGNKRNINIKLICLFIILLCTFLKCSNPKSNYFPLLESNDPIFIYGDNDSGRYYKFIQEYIIDRDGKVFLWDSYNSDHIDVYNENGKFNFEFGKKGQGPGEFTSIANGAIDIERNIWINCNDHRTLKIFSGHGTFIRSILLPKEIAILNIKKMIFSKNNDLYLLCAHNLGNLSIYRYIIKDNYYQLIFEEVGRIPISFVGFTPDFVLDEEGNLYITDSFEYQIYKYSNEGKLLKKYREEKIKKERIIEDDFNIFDGDFKIIKFPEYKGILERLTGKSRYLPAIFGINIDRNKIFIWTSKRDKMNRYLIDVYDKSFNIIGQASYFNYVRRNLSEIVNGNLYIPSIENYNIEMTRRVGRFTLLNIPDRLNAYRISKEIIYTK